MSNARVTSTSRRGAIGWPPGNNKQVHAPRGLIGALCVVLTAGTIGCQKAPETPVVSVRDSAGVRITHNAPGRPANDCVAFGSKLVAQADGGAEARGPQLFRVRGGTVLSDGRIAILNGGGKQLVYFDADGRFLEAVGREGRGPGEFIDPRWLGRGGRDTILVWDPTLARLSIFDGSTLLHTRSGPSASVVGRFADGSLLTRPRAPGFFPSPNGVVRLPESYDRYDPATGAVSHIAEGRSIEWAVGDRGRYTRPFGKEDIPIARGDRLVVGDNGTSSLRIYDLQGELQEILEWSSEPTPVTDQDESEFIAYMREEFPRFPLARALDFPEDRPRFASIAVDDLGWIWVELYSAEWEPPGSWLLFDRDGALRCELASPERIQMLEIGATHVLGTARDGAGEEHIVKYELRRN